MEKAKPMGSHELSQALRKLCPSFLVYDWCKHEHSIALTICPQK